MSKAKSAFKWVEQAVIDSIPLRFVLEPIDGPWGRFYAGSYSSTHSCVVIPEISIEAKKTIGLLSVSYKKLPEIGKSFVIKWSKTDNELALLFIEDLLTTHGFLKNPLEILNRKEPIWKNFSENDPDNQLFTEVIGLWGELNFITQTPKLLNSWSGPFGSDIDVITNDILIEIKTTLKKTYDSVNISNVWQLDDLKKQLYLMVFRLEINFETGKSLTDLVNESAFDNLKPQIKELVLKKLETYSEKLASFKFIIRETKVYPVNEQFPKITKKSLSTCMDKSLIDRIKKINYTISLLGLQTISLEDLRKKIK